MDEVEQRQLEEARKHVDFVIQQLDLSAIKVPDPTTYHGTKTLKEWQVWAETRYNWGATADNDVAKSAMKVIEIIKGHLIILTDNINISYVKLLDVAELRLKKIEVLQKQIAEVDKMALRDENEIKALREEINEIRETINTRKHLESDLKMITEDLTNFLATMLERTSEIRDRFGFAEEAKEIAKEVENNQPKPMPVPEE